MCITFVLLSADIAKAYRDWFYKNLTATERAELIRRGLFDVECLTDPEAALTDRRCDQDKYDFREVEQRDLYRERMQLTDDQQRTTLDEVIDNETNQVDPRLAELDYASIRLRGLIHFLLDGLDASTDPRIRLRADVIRIVVGHGSPPPMATLAKIHGLTKQAISKQCVKLLRQLGLEPSRFMTPRAEVESRRRNSVVKNILKPIVSSTETTHQDVLTVRGIPPGKKSISGPKNDSPRSRPRKKRGNKLNGDMGADNPGKNL